MYTKGFNSELGTFELCPKKITCLEQRNNILGNAPPIELNNGLNVLCGNINICALDNIFIRKDFDPTAYVLTIEHLPDKVDVYIWFFHSDIIPEEFTGTVYLGMLTNEYPPDVSLAIMRDWKRIFPKASIIVYSNNLEILMNLKKVR